MTHTEYAIENQRLREVNAALLEALEKIRDNSGRGCDSPNWMQAKALPGFTEKWECGGCAPCQARLATERAKGTA